MAASLDEPGDARGQRVLLGGRQGTDGFPQQLAKLREAAGLTLDELSEQARYGRSYLHKLETGERPGTAEVISALDRVYGAQGLLVWSWTQCRNGAFLDRFQAYMDLESRAMTLHKYSGGVIPGLLQTAAYCRAQLSTARPRDVDELEEQLAARLSRQSILDRDDPPDLRVVLDEATLTRKLSDPDDWAEQVRHLLTLSERQNVTLQLLPFDAGLQHVLGGSITLLWLPDGSSVAYEESITTGTLVEDPTEVEHLRSSYDRLRDAALSPRETVAYIQRILEDTA